MPEGVRRAGRAVGSGRSIDGTSVGIAIWFAEDLGAIRSLGDYQWRLRAANPFGIGPRIMRR